jgi:hypothetical protein
MIMPITFPHPAALRAAASGGSGRVADLALPRCHTAAYHDACRRGYATMARRRAVITGLARDIASRLPATIARVGTLCSLFAEARVIVFENDSRDDTRAVLRQWAARDRRVLPIGRDIGAPVNPPSRSLERAARMASFRTICQRTVLGSCGDFDVVIVVDLDTAGAWSLDGIAHTFGHEGWDFVGANGLIYRREGFELNALRHYDAWALRFDDAYTPLATADVGILRFQPGEPLVPVTSCFGGLGVYTMPAFAAGCYEGADCEHVGFHRSMAVHGYRRRFLNPSQIVLHGRRWRTFDSCIWSVVGQARMAA